MPKNIPNKVLSDNFSLPKLKFNIKTKNGESVEIIDAKPLVIYFSAKVVNPFAKTIIKNANKSALKNCFIEIGVISFLKYK